MIATVIGTLVALSCLFFWLSCEAVIAANRHPGSGAQSAAPTATPFVDIDLAGFEPGRDRPKTAEVRPMARTNLSPEELGQLTAELRSEIQELDIDSLDFDFSNAG